MIDFKEYIELNEAFNSEPYVTEYELYGASSERYYFEEDANRQYKVEINKAAKTIPLGKDVRTVWISHKSSGKNYKPIIGKFKDPRRVIATVIDILNSYKTEGKFGSKTKGFAIRLNAGNFGPYASLVLKIVKQYMRQQFDAHSTAVKDEETDSAYILIHRKGTDFDAVFSSYVEWHGGDISTSGQTDVPTPVTAPQPEMAPGVSVGEIYHMEDSSVYHVVDSIEDDLVATKAYYKENNKRAMQFDMDETDQDYILDYFELYSPSNNAVVAEPSTVAPNTPPDDKSTQLRATDIVVGNTYHQEDDYVYYKIISIDGDLLEARAYDKTTNKRAMDQDIDETDINYFLDYFEPYTPTKQSVAALVTTAPVAPTNVPAQVLPTSEPAYNTKFKVGDIIAHGGPNPWSYSVVKAIKFNTKINQLDYVMTSYLTSDGSVHTSNIETRVSWIDPEYVIYEPRDYSKPAANTMLRPGDIVKDPSKVKFAIIIKHTNTELEYYAYPDISEDNIKKTTDRKYVRLTNAEGAQEKALKFEPFYDADPVFHKSYYKIGDRLINLTDLVDLTITGIDDVKKEYIAKNQYGMTVTLPFFKSVFLRKALPNEKINRIWQ